MNWRRLRALVVVFGLPGKALVAQPSASVWERTVELSGNYLYGNTEQAILSARTSIIRNDSTVALRVDTRFLIGESSRVGEGRVVDRRSWVINGSVDFHQYAPQSRFIFGSIERSLELRIDRRVSAGIGQKVSFIRDSTTRFDFSVGILGEQSVLPQPTPGGEPPLPAISTSLVRLSGRLRYRRNLSSRVGIDHTTWYRPEAAAFGRYLASSVTALSYSVGKRTHLQLSFQNDFDSLARSRGSRSNQNGQILVGVSTKF